MDFRLLVERAARAAVPRDAGEAPRWSAVKDVFMVGKTTAFAICREFGIDEDQAVQHPGSKELLQEMKDAADSEEEEFG